MTAIDTERHIYYGAIPFNFLQICLSWTFRFSGSNQPLDRPRSPLDLQTSANETPLGWQLVQYNIHPNTSQCNREWCQM